jgi:Tol biopolymer transport system component
VTSRLTASGDVESNPAWSPDGNSLVFSATHEGNTDLWIRDISGQARPLTSHLAEDTQPSWSPDGRRIAFVSSRGRALNLDKSVFYGYSLGGAIWTMPAIGGAAEMVVEDGFNPAWSPQGEQIAFDASLDGPRRIWVSSPAGDERRQVTQDKSDLAAHMQPAWSADGRWIVYERQEGSQSSTSGLYLVPAKGGTEIPITGDDHRNFSPAWIESSAIVFSSDRGGTINLWQQQIDPSSGRPVGDALQITLGPGEDLQPAISNNGRLVYVAARALRNIWSVQIDPATWRAISKPSRLMDAAWNDFAPAISPDLDRLAFSSDRDGQVDIWMLNLASRGVVRFTSGAGQDLQPDWSPDGELLAYFSDAGGNNDIWVVSSKGGEPIQITDHEADDINPFWSPDGARIAFMSDRSGQAEIWLMNRDGTGLEQVTTSGATAHTARWSPDGKWILYTAMSTGDREQWAVREDGSDRRRLTTSPAQDAHGLWSYDGSYFLFLSDHHTVRASSFEGASEIEVLDLGERIDYLHLSPDSQTLFFTRERIESDLWLME